MLRLIKCNVKTAKAQVKVTCWLSALQWANKGALYKWVLASQGRLTPLDWGDRVLLVCEPTGSQPATRWVADTSIAPDQFVQLVKGQFSKWHLEWPADAAVQSAGHKRPRWRN